MKISAEENVGYVTKCYEINCDVMEAQIMCDSKVFIEIMDKTPTHAPFTQHNISLAC